MAITPTPLTKAIEILRSFGFFDTIIPFILVFALVYGILRFTKVLGDPDQPKTNAVNVVISFAIAFLVIATTNVVKMINALVPNTTLLLVVALMALLLLGFVGFKTQSYIESSKAGKIIAVVIILIFAGVLFYSFGWNVLGAINLTGVNLDASVIQNIFTTQFVNLMIGFGLLIGLPLLVVYFITKSK